MFTYRQLVWNVEYSVGIVNNGEEDNVMQEENLPSVFRFKRYVVQ